MIAEGTIPPAGESITQSVFQVPELRVKGKMMGEKFSFQQEKQKWGKWVEGGGCSCLFGMISEEDGLGAVC